MHGSLSLSSQMELLEYSNDRVTIYVHDWADTEWLIETPEALIKLREVKFVFFCPITLKMFKELIENLKLDGMEVLSAIGECGVMKESVEHMIRLYLPNVKHYNIFGIRNDCRKVS